MDGALVGVCGVYFLLLTGIHEGVQMQGNWHGGDVRVLLSDGILSISKIRPILLIIYKWFQKKLGLIFPIIINTALGSILLGHTLLLPIHLRHCPRCCRFLGLLVFTRPDIPWEAQRDALTCVPNLIRSRLVAGAEREVCRLDLPYKLRLKPDVGLVLGYGRVQVEWLRFVDSERG